MTAIGWTRSRSAAILRELLNGKGLSHEALDAENNTAAANFLRALLMFTGVLPGRASELDDTLEWLTQRLGAVQPQHQTIVLLVRDVARTATGEGAPSPPGNSSSRTRTSPPRPTPSVGAGSRRAWAPRVVAVGVRPLARHGPPARVEIRDFISLGPSPRLADSLRVPFTT